MTYSIGGQRITDLSLSAPEIWCTKFQACNIGLQLRDSVFESEENETMKNQRRASERAR